MAKPRFQNITGMPDILPRDRRVFGMVEDACFKVSSYYGYERIETPVLEYAEIFEKGTGEATDIVQKQMYSFKTEGDDFVTLRPEFTPGIVRAYTQHGMASWPHPVKISTFGPLFRHERPQSGRFREFRQFEIDAIGDLDPVIDAQIILIFYKIIQSVGIKNLNVQVNSTGCAKCKPVYKRILRDYYRGRERSLCKDCRQRVKINLLRVLDCKDEKCERLKIGAPEVVDYLCSDCHDHLKEVLEILDEVAVPYVLSPHLVRGLDYYTKTVFEIFPVLQDKKSLNGENITKIENDDNEGEKKDKSEKLEEEKNAPKISAIAGGGRFDDLVKLFGGDDTPAVGGSLGIERTASLIRMLGVKAQKERVPHVFFIHLGDLAKRKGLGAMEEFRASGIFVSEALGKPSIRVQMGLADKLGVDYALILGHQEVAEETIILRDMKSGSQEVIPMNKAIKEVKRRLKR